MLATGNDLLVLLKANHPTLPAAVQAYCQAHPEDDRSHRSDIGRRNRLESRQVRRWQLPAGTGPEPWHDHCKVAIEVRRSTEGFDPTRKDFVLRQEAPAYYPRYLHWLGADPGPAHPRTLGHREPPPPRP